MRLVAFFAILTASFLANAVDVPNHYYDSMRAEFAERCKDEGYAKLNCSESDLNRAMGARYNYCQDDDHAESATCKSGGRALYPIEPNVIVNGPLSQRLGYYTLSGVLNSPINVLGLSNGVFSLNASRRSITSEECGASGGRWSSVDGRSECQIEIPEPTSNENEIMSGFTERFYRAIDSRSQNCAAIEDSAGSGTQPGVVAGIAPRSRNCGVGDFFESISDAGKGVGLVFAKKMYSNMSSNRRRIVQVLVVVGVIVGAVKDQGFGASALGGDISFDYDHSGDEDVTKVMFSLLRIRTGEAPRGLIPRIFSLFNRDRRPDSVAPAKVVKKSSPKSKSKKRQASGQR